jgi:hypothetical protein
MTAARTGRGLVAAATTDGRQEVVFLTSRQLERPTAVTITGLPAGSGPAQWRVLAGPDLFAANTLERPDTLHWSKTGVAIDGGRAELTLPPGGTGALVITLPERDLRS